MKPLLHLVEIRDVPILQQLEWEEALLRADQRNWCLINRGSPPAIVMGISGKIDELVCSKQLEQGPLPVIRRFSGGGTVVIDENTLFVTFIFQSSALSIQPFPRHLMNGVLNFTVLYSLAERSSCEKMIMSMRIESGVGMHNRSQKDDGCITARCFGISSFLE